MKSPTLRVEKRDRVAFWTIDRPESMNALNAQVLTEILDAMEAAEADPDVRAVVLTGSGDRAFSAGVLAFVRPLLEKSPALLKLGKQAFYQLPGMGYEQGLEHLRAMKSVVTLTADSREGLAALAQKRSPEWTGN